MNSSTANDMAGVHYSNAFSLDQNESCVYTSNQREYIIFPPFFTDLIILSNSNQISRLDPLTARERIRAGSIESQVHRI